MKNNTVCILSGGTGNPFFTTDTAAALRAVEIGADVLLKGTRVDGVYTSDPEKDTHAVKYDVISFEEVINKRLKVMDSTAFTMCRENNLPVIVFDMNEPGNLNKIIDGEKIGTLVYRVGSERSRPFLTYILDISPILLILLNRHPDC